MLEKLIYDKLEVNLDPVRSAKSFSAKVGIRRAALKAMKIKGLKPNRLTSGVFERPPERPSYTDPLHRVIREWLHRGSSPSQPAG